MQPFPDEIASEKSTIYDFSENDEESKSSDTSTDEEYNRRATINMANIPKKKGCTTKAPPSSDNLFLILLLQQQ